MTRWLVIGGAFALAYLVFTTRANAATPVPGQNAKPLPAAPPVQNPLPPAQPHTTIVPGAGSSILDDIQQGTEVAGSLYDLAKKFGIFGGDESGGIQADPATRFAGAAF
jgi:hypothetical protein